MKKHLFYVMALACLIGLAGCGKTRWDYPNENVVISVRNAAGDNLLFYPTVGKLGISATYDGRTYPLKNVPTRAGDGEPVFDDLYLVITDYSSVITFGQFSIDTRGYHGEEFTLNFGDGTKYEIKFDLYATSNGKKEPPTIHRTTWVKDASGEWQVNTDNQLVVSIVKQ
jgi:hypothetical protein